MPGRSGPAGVGSVFTDYHVIWFCSTRHQDETIRSERLRMDANHLVIGLGGTGGKIIRALRKKIYQEFRKESPDGANLDYLYVDSSNEMMGLDDPSWKILGTSVQLNKKSQLLIQEANLTSRLENINNYPGIKPWIGSQEQWKDILGSIIGVTLGGQKRRLGRFLFACKID